MSNLSNLADACEVAEQSKISAALEMRLSMEIERKNESACALLFLSKIERSKLSLITIGDCACVVAWENSRGGLQRVLQLGTEEARFRMAAAEDPRLGFSRTKLQIMGLERQFEVGGLVDFGQTKFGNSYIVGELQSAVFVPIRLLVPWGKLVRAVGALVLLRVEWRALSSQNERWSFVWSLCFWFYMWRR